MAKGAKGKTRCRKTKRWYTGSTTERAARIQLRRASLARFGETGVSSPPTRYPVYRSNRRRGRVL